MGLSKRTTPLIIGVLFLVFLLVVSGMLGLGWKVAQQRKLTRLKTDNPVEYYVLHTPAGKDEEMIKGGMTGTWRLAGAKSRKTGNFVLLVTPTVYLKTFTLTNWAIATYDTDSNLLYSAGGPYTLQGDVYTEIIETATGAMKQYRGARPQFRIRLNGDTFYQMGAGLNPAIEEMWQRVAQ